MMDHKSMMDFGISVHFCAYLLKRRQYDIALSRQCHIEMFPGFLQWVIFFSN